MVLGLLGPLRGDDTTPFHSILFETDAPGGVQSESRPPAYFGDLHLDKIVEAATTGPDAPELARPNPAQVLAPRVPVAGWAEAVDRGPVHRPSRLRRLSRCRSTSARMPATRDDQPAGIQDDRVEQLDLQSDDRPDARLMGSAGKPDSAIEALVIGDRQRGRAKLDRPFDQVFDGRGAVEEREIGVAVEFAVTAGYRPIIEPMF